jgi:hypothetical protein
MKDFNDLNFNENDIKIAVPNEAFTEALDPRVKDLFLNMIEELKSH